MSDVSLIVPLPLEQMLCPTGPHAAFRAAEDRGPKGAFHSRVSISPGIPLEILHI